MQFFPNWVVFMFRGFRVFSTASERAAAKLQALSMANDGNEVIACIRGCKSYSHLERCAVLRDNFIAKYESESPQVLGWVGSFELEMSTKRKGLFIDTICGVDSFCGPATDHL